MNMHGNTILITGGGSGIGLGLAKALQQAGNTVIIAGRRQRVLDEVIKANPGMKAITLDIDSAAAIQTFAAKVTAEFPALNVLINNAGIMRPEIVTKNPQDVSTAEAIITTNLLGPIRLTGALLPHLQKQKSATVINVTSGLAFVPMAVTPTYCATKAAIHSYTVSLREQLKGTSVEMLELAPPYVQTELMGAHQAADPRAMPLDEFIAEVMSILASPPASGEIIVERCKPLRFAEANGTFDQTFAALTAMAAEH